MGDSSEDKIYKGLVVGQVVRKWGYGSTSIAVINYLDTPIDQVEVLRIREMGSDEGSMFVKGDNVTFTITRRNGVDFADNLTLVINPNAMEG